MAADDYLAENINGSGYDAILRFYIWEPPAVSLGRNQSSEIVDISGCKERGWDVVYRPTGGRALLHHGDLSYSLILSPGNNVLSTLRYVYNAVADAFVESLGMLGIVVCKTSTSRNRVLASERKYRKDICMTSRVRGEIIHNERKLVSAAQRIYDDAFLQHGSISLNTNPALIAEVMNIDDSIKGNLKRYIESVSCSYADLTNSQLNKSVLMETLMSGFSKRLDLEFTNDPFRKDEIQVINQNFGKFAISTLEDIPVSN